MANARVYPVESEVADSLDLLAELYTDRGRYAAAEPLLERALEIRENALRSQDRSATKSVAAIRVLAEIYERQGRYDKIETLHRRVLAIWKNALGDDRPNNPNPPLNASLGDAYNFLGRYGEAESHYRRALEIWEALWPGGPFVAGTLDSLAEVYRNQGRYSETEPLLKRALAIYEKAHGPHHVTVVKTLTVLAEIYRNQGRYDEAEPLLKRVLAHYKKWRNPHHPEVATSLHLLAEVYRDQGRFAEAFELIRRASAIHRARAARIGRTRSAGVLEELVNVRNVFALHIDIVASVMAHAPDQHADLIAESFEAGQLAHTTSAAAAVAQMGARFAAGDDTLARAVRARQDAIERWRKLDSLLVGVMSGAPEKLNAQSGKKEL